MRERHRDLDAAALAVRRLRERALREVIESHANEYGTGAVDERRLTVETHERVPAEPREGEQREHHVAKQRVAREERDDLVRAADPEVGAPATRHARDVGVEQRDGAAVGF